MALTISSVGSGTGTTAGPTLATGATVTASVGDWLVVFVSCKNQGTSGAASISSVVDSDGSNTYTQRAIINYDPGAAGDGTTLGIFTCAVTSALASDTVTVNFSPDTGIRAVNVYRVQPSGAPISFVAVDSTGLTGNATTYAANTVSVTSGHVIFGAASIETDDTITGDSDTTNGSWSTVSTILSDGGADAKAQSIVTQYKVVSSTGNQSWAATTGVARDYATSYVILKEGYDLSADAGSYAVTGQTAGLFYGYALAADSGSYTVTGQTATLQLDIPLAADPGSYAITGTDASLQKGLTLNADAGSYAVTGQTAGLAYGYAIAADAGAYSVTGQTAALEWGQAVGADVGDYAVTGAGVSLENAKTIGAEAGSVTLSGTDAGLEFGRSITADAGSYGVVGTAADLTLSTVGGYEINADSGSYSIGGTAAAAEYGRALIAESGTYDVAGQAAGIQYGRLLGADAGSYAVAGEPVGTLYGRLIVADGGGYTIVGDDSSLSQGRALSSDAGSYAVFGDTAVLTASSDGYVGSASGNSTATAIGVAREWRATGNRPGGAQGFKERSNRQSAVRRNTQPDGVRR